MGDMWHADCLFVCSFVVVRLLSFVVHFYIYRYINLITNIFYHFDDEVKLRMYVLIL